MTTTGIAKRDIVALVATKIAEFQKAGSIDLPADYSVGNALKSAMLILQSTLDKNQKPVLEACTEASIMNSLLDMIVQGLNPGKDQCYFIAYGSALSCQRSYFGAMAVCMRVAKAEDVWAEVVYEGDEFTYSISHNRKNVINHVQKIENVLPDKIRAAYCVIEFGEGRLPYTEIMTKAQIEKAWEMSKTRGGGVHKDFPDQMTKKTVINRACKAFINASSDAHLFLEAYNRADDERAEEELAKEIAENAHTEELPEAEVDPGAQDKQDVDQQTGEIIPQEQARDHSPEGDPLPKRLGPEF